MDGIASGDSFEWDAATDQDQYFSACGYHIVESNTENVLVYEDGIDNTVEITNLDLANNRVSGSFNFETAADSTGQIYLVEGTFTDLSIP